MHSVTRCSRWRMRMLKQEGFGPLLYCMPGFEVLCQQRGDAIEAYQYPTTDDRRDIGHVIGMSDDTGTAHVVSNCFQ